MEAKVSPYFTANLKVKSGSDLAAYNLLEVSVSQHDLAVHLT